MKLTRDKIQRMMGERRGSTTSSTGSGGGGIIGNGVTPEYYNQNFELLYKQTVTSGGTTTTTYLTALPNEVVAVGTVTDETTGDVTVTTLIGPVAKNALVIGNLMFVYDSQNNAIKVVNRDGVTPASFYATGSVSALGYAAGGGGVGASALTDLVDVAISSPTNGQVLMYNSTTGKWYNGTVQQGSSAWSDITGKPTTIAGYGITDAKIQNGTITLGSNSITPLTSVAFSDLTSHPSTLSGYGITDAKFGSTGTDYIPITLGSTTKNVLISHQSLSGYLSTSGGTMTNTNLVTNMNADLLDGMHVVTPGTPTANGVYAQRIPFIGSNYVMEVGRYLDFHTANGTGDFTTRLYLHENSNNTVDANGNSVMLPSGTGVLALTSDNVASATKLQNARTIWGQSFDGTGNIIGDMNDVWTINGKLKIGNGVTGIRIGPDNNTCNVSINGITSTRTINLNYGTSHSATDGGGIFFHYGNNISPSTSNLMQTTSLIIGESSRPSDEPDTPIFAIYSPTSDKVKVMIGQDNTSANGCSLQIGMVRLVYDSTNNALKVEKVDGTSASFYATGSVSALGFSAGTSAVDAMTFGYLTVNNRLYIENTSNYIYHDSDGINLKAGAGEQIYCQSRIYAQNGIESDGDLIMGSDIRMYGFKIYLTSSAYIYVSGNTLYFSNGTTTRTIATL